MKLEELPRLKNGMPVIITPATYLPTVGIAIGAKYGSIYEDKRINGSAHALEHMLFQGTPKRTAQNFEDFTRAHSLNRNAFTAPETVVYMVKAHRSETEPGIEMLSDMIKNSAVTKEDFENEKGPIVSEILSRADDPFDLLYDQTQLILFEGQKAGASGAGEKEAVMGLTRDELVNIYMQNYTPANMVLSIYGGISRDKAMGLAEQYFGDFQRPYSAPVVPDSPGLSRPKTVELEKKGMNGIREVIGFGFPGSRSILQENPRDLVSLLVLQRLVKKTFNDGIRDEIGNADSVTRVDPEIYGTFGMFKIWVNSSKRKFGKINGIINSELEKLVSGQINEEILNNSATLYLSESEMGRDSPLNMSIAGAFELAVHSVQLSDFDYIARELNAEDIQHAAQKYLNKDRRASIILKPPGYKI